MGKQLPSWVTDAGTWLIVSLIGALAWFLTGIVGDFRKASDEVKSDVRKLYDTVYQLRQDVAVMGAVLDTKTKLCKAGQK